METRVNLVLFGALIVAWGASTFTAPAALIHPTSDTRGLAALEDAFAVDRDDSEVARDLADRYLALREPQLAIAALSSTSAELREDPAILHRLAMAYEETGRMRDATATARLALARCARALGTSGSSSVTPVPRHACSERTYAALDMHANALDHMARWGVIDVHTDARARRAYALAVRSARILSATAE